MYTSEERNESLIQCMLLERALTKRDGIYGFTQRELAYNSNRIEGSALTKEHTASLFETGTLKSDDFIFRAKDIEEMNGHFYMFNYMLSTIKEPLSEKLIKNYHKCLKTGVFEDIANGYPIGEYKNRENFVWNISTTLPEEVPEKMQNLISTYNQMEKGVDSVLWFHVNFEKIHPFQDGNGRTGRMIMFRECLVNGISPIIIQENYRDEYIHAINDAQTKQDFSKLKSICEKCAQEYTRVAYPYADFRLKNPKIELTSDNFNRMFGKECVIEKEFPQIQEKLAREISKGKFPYMISMATDEFIKREPFYRKFDVSFLQKTKKAATIVVYSREDDNLINEINNAINKGLTMEKLTPNEEKAIICAAKAKAIAEEQEQDMATQEKGQKTPLQNGNVR